MFTRTVIAAAAALAMSGGVALAGGNSAIGNQTTTSMGAPAGSPGDAAARSAVIPGLPPQTREAQADNAAAGRHVDQSLTAPVQGPATLGGKTQTTN